jgi:uncharacterized protein (DUF58 family)
MQSNGWTLQSKNRLLDLSVGGRWYIGFVLALGVVAIYSGNNVIYLLESMLLASLLLSGALSEYAITRVVVRRQVDSLHAGAPGEDIFVIENLGRFPIYCLELGEYSGRNRYFTAFLLYIPAHGKMRVASRPVIDTRGRHRWDGLVVATSFPFAFARKSRLVPDPGSRIVWPGKIDGFRFQARENSWAHGEMETATGELSPVEPWDDASRVHWPASARFGELLARPLRWSEKRNEVRLEVREPSPEMEGKICLAAAALSCQADTLVLLRSGEPQVIQGSRRGLDALALLPKVSV